MGFITDDDREAHKEYLKEEQRQAKAYAEKVEQYRPFMRKYYEEVALQIIKRAKENVRKSGSCVQFSFNSRALLGQEEFHARAFHEMHPRMFIETLDRVLDMQHGATYIISPSQRLREESDYLRDCAETLLEYSGWNSAWHLNFTITFTPPLK